MKKLHCFLALLISFSVQAQSGYKIGDKVQDFSLLDVKKNTMVSLSNHASSKVVVLVFTSHSCPYTKIYEQRAKEFIEEYRKKEVAFLLINPNNPASYPEDAPAEMAKAASERGYTTPYLSDASQQVANMYGANKTPEVFILKNQGGVFYLKYKGAIDDNPQVAKDVTATYVKDALDALLGNRAVKISEKRATGCVIHR
jgi:peroxiredoxin